MFAAERARLLGRLGDTCVRVEHIGSTSVPGMPSKPTIDVLLVVRAIDDVLDQLDTLYELGYDWRAFFFDTTDHVYFRRVVDEKRTHHLHALAAGARAIDDYLDFRDFLIADAEAAAEYAATKRALIIRFEGDRMGYVDAKSLVVDELMVRMRAETAR